MSKIKNHEQKMLSVKMLVTLKRNPQYLTPKQLESLKNSIKKDGFVAPILVRPIKNDRYEVVSDNHRLFAAIELGFTEVPAIVAKLDSRAAKRLAVNLNTVHGEPNAELLAPFLGEMDDITLQGIHLEDDLIQELVNFDEDLADRLAELSVPPSLNHDSPKHKNIKCVCPKCGREHFKK